MNAARSIAASRHVARRAWVRSLTAHTGRALSIACGVSLAMVGAAKAWAMPAWWAAAVWLPPIVGVIAGAMLAWRDRWSVIRAATAADEHLATGDALRTAIELGDRADDPFVRLAVERGEAAAAKVDAARVVGSLRHSSWIVWPGLAAVSVAVWMLVPRVARDMPKKTTTAEHVAEAVRDLQSAAARVASEDGADSTTTSAEANATHLEELKALEQELAAGKIDPTTARSKAAEALNEAADQEAARLAEAQRSADTARARLSRAASTPSGADDASASGELKRALSKGDVQAATEAVERLREQTPRLTAEERAKLAEDLDDLASTMEKEERAAAAEREATEGEETPPDGATPTDREAASREALPKREPLKPELAKPDLSKPDLTKPELVKAEPKASAKPKPSAEQEIREALRDASRSLREEPKPAAESAPKNAEPSEAPKATGEKKPEDGSAKDEKREDGKRSSGNATRKPEDGRGQESKSGEEAKRARDEASPRTPQGQEKKEGEPDGKQPEKESRDAAEKPDGKAPNATDGSPPKPQPQPTSQDLKKSPSQTPKQTSGDRTTHSGGERTKTDGVSNAEETKDGTPEMTPETKPTGAENASGEGKREEKREEKPTAKPDGGRTPIGEGEKKSPAERRGEVKKEEPKPTTTPDTLRETLKKSSDVPGKLPEKRPEALPKMPDQLPEQLPPMPKMRDEALEQLAKRFRDLSKNFEKNPPSQQQIDRLRRQAQELLERSTPEQREQLERLAQKLAKDVPPQDGAVDGPPPPPSESAKKGDPSAPEREGALPKDGDPSAENLPKSGERKDGRDPSDPRTMPGPNGEPKAEKKGAPPARGDSRRESGGGNRGSNAGDGAATRRLGPTPQAWTGETETVDARPKATPEGSKPRLLAEVLNPDGRARKDASSEPSLNSELREAAKGAERAIEQQSVPSARSEYIRRVFRRYVERTTPGAVSPTQEFAKPTTTPDAADASKAPKK